MLCLSEQSEVDAVDWTDPDAAHAALGTRSLVVLREPMPEWEHSLKSLERLAQDASEKERNKSTQSTQVEKRLVWEADLDSYRMHVQPREQRRNKNGTWSKGRNLALKRLALEAGSLDFLTDQDRAAANAISAVHVWNKIDYVLNSGPGLYALAGHPHVFDQHGEPLEVYRREPELHVEEGVDGTAIVRIEPHGGEEEREFGVTPTTHNRIEVTRFSESHRKLFEIVEREGLSIPPDGKSRLLEAVSALASQVRLHALAAASLGDLFEEADLAPNNTWLKLRCELDSARTFEPELPSTLQAELRPYQVDGYRWLSRLSRLRAGACLADDMGLGKTVQTLAVLLERAPGGPALVVAPTSVVANWIDEAHRFAPTLKVKMYTGGVADRAGLLDEPAPFDLFVTTYGVMQNDIERLREIAWHSLVLDEAQAIKNPTTRRAHAARRLNAQFRIVTTGTPIQNNLMDLHSLFNFLNPGLLGSQERFRDNEGQIVELHRHKRDLAYQLLEGADAVGKLSTDDLLELLRQSP